MTKPFFDLKSTHNPHRWCLPVTRNLSVGPPGKPFLFGGAALAAAVSAMEQTCGRPAIWATAQYLSFARPPSIVDLDVWTPNQGRHTSQARVIGHVNDREIITVNAALGERPGDIADQWVTPPPAPPPEDCPVTDHWRAEVDDLNYRFELRAVSGRLRGKDKLVGRGQGRVVVWARLKEAHPVGSDVLCVMADFVAQAISDAIGLWAGGNSLDNTIRFARLVPTEWVLCDMRIEAVQNGVAHGVQHLYSQSGVLMASASQSLILRVHETPAG
ncbi:MAG: thioesterase family protein [Caulobacteraceae bacterium]|nr:thioesterase family protein [Caulobacteraceae bacterium]